VAVMATHEIDWKLLNHIQERSVEDRVSGCWIWSLSANSSSYGNVVRFARQFTGGDGQNHNAHRLAYQAMFGDIPDHLEIDHLCGRKDCVNPHHMEAVDHSTNMRRNRIAKPHPLTSWMFPNPDIAAPTYSSTCYVFATTTST
jgi:hypothetical protein